MKQGIRQCGVELWPGAVDQHQFCAEHMHQCQVVHYVDQIWTVEGGTIQQYHESLVAVFADVGC
jgi:hypothetical protein